MNHLPWANRLMIVGLLALSAVQLVLSFQFWGSFSAGISALAWQALGVTLSVIEAVLLIVCSNAARNGNIAAASAGRIAFACCFALNLVCDIGAAINYIDHDAHQRADAAASFQTATSREEELTTKINALHAVSASDRLDQSSEALDTLLATEEGILAQTPADSKSLAYRQRRVAKIKSAQANAKEIERLSAERDTYRLKTDGHAKPADAHPEVQTLQAMAGWAGVNASTDEVQRGIAIGLAFVVRLLLGVGYWVAMSAGKGEQDDEDNERDTRPRRNFSDSIGDALKRFTGLRRANQQPREPRSPQAFEQERETSLSAASKVEPLLSQRDERLVDIRPFPDRKPDDVKFSRRSPEIPSAGIHVTRTGDPVTPDGKPLTQTTHHVKRGRRHNPKTCPTCKTEFVAGQVVVNKLDALDDLDPAR